MGNSVSTLDSFKKTETDCVTCHWRSANIEKYDGAVDYSCGERTKEDGIVRSLDDY